MMMMIVPFQSFADSSHGGIVEQHVQCTQILVHLAESAARSVWQQSVALSNELRKQKVTSCAGIKPPQYAPPL